MYCYRLLPPGHSCTASVQLQETLGPTFLLRDMENVKNDWRSVVRFRLILLS